MSINQFATVLSPTATIVTLTRVIDDGHSATDAYLRSNKRLKQPVRY